MDIGRPPKFATVEALQAGIDAYFAECVAKDMPITITGLALALDTSREVLMYVERGTGPYSNPLFSDAIKRAKLRCQNYAENHLFSGKNPAAGIFALKNYGWSDRQELELSGPGGDDIKVRFTNSDDE